MSTPKHTRLRIAQPGFPAVEFLAEVADTPALRQQGLRGRWPVVPMLLAWTGDARDAIVSDGMSAAFDVAFLDANGRVVSYAVDVGPDSPPVVSPHPYRFALELPHGTLRSLGIGGPSPFFWVRGL